MWISARPTHQNPHSQCDKSGVAQSHRPATFDLPINRTVLATHDPKTSLHAGHWPGGVPSCGGPWSSPVDSRTDCAVAVVPEVVATTLTVSPVATPLTSDESIV